MAFHEYKPRALQPRHLQGLFQDLVLSESRDWLRQYATSQQAAGSIPNEVIGIFQLT
jgi:hypothetical protein